MRENTFLSNNILPVFLFTKIGIGTPHALCLEIHQSGRASSIDFIRFLDKLGNHDTLSIAARAFFLRLFFERLINHCGVILKIKGALERHE